MLQTHCCEPGITSEASWHLALWLLLIPITLSLMTIHFKLKIYLEIKLHFLISLGFHIKAVLWAIFPPKRCRKWIGDRIKCYKVKNNQSCSSSNIQLAYFGCHFCYSLFSKNVTFLLFLFSTLNHLIYFDNNTIFKLSPTEMKDKSQFKGILFAS